MADQRIPFARFALLTSLASAPPVGVFAVLALTGRLGWDISVLCAAICVIVLALMVRRGLGDVYRVLEFSQTLARDGAGELPAREMSGLFPEFTEAVNRLQLAWGQERGQLDARASSAENVIESLPQPLILLNADRQIVRATQGFRNILGETLPGRDLSSVLRAPEVLEAVDRTLGGSGDEDVEFEIEFPTGRAINAQIRGLTRQAVDGTVVVIALFDITEIRKIQKMRTDFVANASHELRTPLAVLSGSIQTLKGPARDDREGQVKFLDMMEQHTSRMTRLIDDLLSLSRIEVSENTRPQGEIDLSEILSNIATVLKVAAARRQIDIVLEPGLGDHRITGDAVEISQLFQNLVDNAVKYSDENSTVRVVTREALNPFGTPGAEHSQYIEISVIDRGPGIPREHIPRLTERFYRVDTARSREMGGTGLGLAIVKHIVNRHRGQLSIESVEGEGTTFTVHLPTSIEIPRPPA